VGRVNTQESVGTSIPYPSHERETSKAKRKGREKKGENSWPSQKKLGTGVREGKPISERASEERMVSDRSQDNNAFTTKKKREEYDEYKGWGFFTSNGKEHETPPRKTKWGKNLIRTTLLNKTRKKRARKAARPKPDLKTEKLNFKGKARTNTSATLKDEAVKESGERTSTSCRGIVRKIMGGLRRQASYLK